MLTIIGIVPPRVPAQRLHDAAARQPDLPRTPELRNVYEELLSQMRVLERPTDSDIEALDRRVRELATRLAALGEDSPAGALYEHWGRELGLSRSRPQQGIEVSAAVTSDAWRSLPTRVD
jgi:hypothetical protein